MLTVTQPLVREGATVLTPLPLVEHVSDLCFLVMFRPFKKLRVRNASLMAVLHLKAELRITS